MFFGSRGKGIPGDAGNRREMIRINDIASRVFHDDEKRVWFAPLVGASLLYRAGVSLRNVLYDAGVFRTQKVPCRVVSVGNIMVGGTGKTPMVIMLARMLKEAGWRPAVLSRGYGGKKRDEIGVVSNGREVLMDPREAGDEPVLIAHSIPEVPVIVASDRARAGRVALESFGTDVLILDDGFQHRRLARDIDIVLLDGNRPFGNGFLLPRGGLREPQSSLRRADMVILTSAEGSNTPPLGNRYSGSVFAARRRPVELVKKQTRETCPLDCLSGKRICAFSGIANPWGFRETLEPLCGEIVSFLPFPDHHIYTAADVEHIRKAFDDSGAQALVTTEKDGVKLRGFADSLSEVYQLRIEMEIIDNPAAFENDIRVRLKR